RRSASRRGCRTRGTSARLASVLYSSVTLPATPNLRSSGCSAAEDSPVSDGGPSVTWLGHATAVAELAGARVVFDPFLRARARAAGRVDAVLITHSHVDHLNRWSLKAIARDAHLVVPRGCKGIVADLGFAKVNEVTAGDQLEIAGLEV